MIRSQASDQYLVMRCLAGDEGAWHALVRRYRRLIYHFPSQAKLPQSDCDEIFQETLIALYNYMDRIEQVEDLSRWLSRVARRNTWKVLNQRGLLADLADFPEIPDPEDGADQLLELRLQQHKIREALQGMDKRCRKLLVMLFYESDDYDYKTIAQELGIAMGSIGPTRNRCLVKFRKQLEKLGINESNVSKWL